MAVRYSIGVGVILIFIICQTSSKPQNFGSRRYPPERTEADNVNVRPSPTNEVYASQLSQPSLSSTPPLRRHHTRRQSGVQSSPTTESPRPQYGSQASGLQRGAATPPRPGVVRLTSTTLHVDQGTDVVKSVVWQHNTSVEHDALDNNSTSDLDKVIEEIFNGMPGSHRNVQAESSRRSGVQPPVRNKTQQPDKGPSGKSRIKLPNDNGMIIFPSEAPSPSSGSAWSNSPIEPCPDGMTFCNNVPNYPSNRVQAFLRKTSAFATLFGKDEVQPQANITQRIDNSEEQSLCQSVESVVYPEKGMNMDDKWLYIVNLPQHQQGVRIETCSSPDKECEFTNFVYGYQSFCKQKYIYRKLVTFSPASDTPQPDSIKLPACCSCHLRSLDIASARSGFDPTRQSPAKKSRRRRAKPHGDKPAPSRGRNGGR